MERDTAERLLREGIESTKARRYDEALKSLVILEESDPGNPEVHYHLGLCYANVRQLDRAALHLEQVVEQAGAGVYVQQARMVLGYLHTVREMYELAELEFSKVLEYDFDCVPAYAALGYVYSKKRQFPLAIEYLRRAIELAPANANAHNSLGYVYLEANEDLRRALQECRLAVRLDPGNAAYHDSLGWTYYRMGKLDLARGSLRKALELAPEDAEIRRHMSEVVRTDG